MHLAINDMPVEIRTGDVTIRGLDWAGVWVRSITLPAGTDLTPSMHGLPDDRCGCPHWGYVLDGSMTVRYSDGAEETTHAGQLFYWPPGHTGWTTDGVTFLEFSPTETIMPVLEHFAAQLQ